MWQRIISRIFRGRHYWHSLSFDEIAELYTSRLITVFAINVVNLFAAVYLYKLGYSLGFITLFYASIYAIKVPFSLIAAKIAAYVGPKHGILYANLLRIPSLVSFALVPMAGDNALLAVLCFGVLQQLASTLYDLCYMIDFSKVKHAEHAGKEIGTMQIIEKIAKIISPLIGGVLASLFSPQVTIVVASLAFALAAWPLLRTVEPTMTRGKLQFAGYPWRLTLPSIVSASVVGIDFVVSGMVWSLFTALFVFAELHDTVYAVLGGLASLGVLVSIASAWFLGQIVDRRKGDVLLIAGTASNVIIHSFRPFVSTAAGVVGVNIANETATSAYTLPFTRVTFDIADTSGFRITYLMYIEMVVNAATALACLVLWAMIGWWGERQGLAAMFIVAAVYELLMLLSARAAR